MLRVHDWSQTICIAKTGHCSLLIDAFVLHLNVLWPWLRRVAMHGGMEGAISHWTSIDGYWHSRFWWDPIAPRSRRILKPLFDVTRWSCNAKSVLKRRLARCYWGSSSSGFFFSSFLFFKLLVRRRLRYHICKKIEIVNASNSIGFLRLAYSD
jgi:hypothetical protein